MRDQGRQLRFARELLSCDSAEALVGRTAAYLSTTLRAPVAAWLPIPDREELVLTAVEGFPSGARSQALAQLMVTPAAVGRTRALESLFGDVAGCESSTRLDLGGPVAVCGVADIPASLAEDLSVVVQRVLSLQRAGSGRSRDAGLALSQTAHELRGPLAAARAALDRAIESGGTEAIELVKRARAELGYSYRLIEELLHWTMEGRSLRRRTVDLVGIVREAVRSCELELGPSVSLHTPSRLAVRAHRVSLRGAVANVVRNAIVHSPARRPVEVEVLGEGRSARIRVRDRGAGIPAAMGTDVFEPFVREGGSMSGTGLGLFIAKRVIEAHHGKIWFESLPRGTTFHLELPVAS